MPRDFDTWNTRENFLSQNPRKASQERLLLVYLVFTCYWRQICYTQLSKPSPKLRSWAPLLNSIWCHCVLTIKPINHQAYWPSSLLTSGLPLWLLSLLACFTWTLNPKISKISLCLIDHIQHSLMAITTCWWHWQSTLTDDNW